MHGELLMPAVSHTHTHTHTHTLTHSLTRSLTYTNKLMNNFDDFCCCPSRNSLFHNKALGSQCSRRFSQTVLKQCWYDRDRRVWYKTVPLFKMCQNSAVMKLFPLSKRIKTVLMWNSSSDQNVPQIVQIWNGFPDQNVSRQCWFETIPLVKMCQTVQIWNSSCDQNAPKQCCYECETVPPVKMCQDRSDVTQFHWSTFVKTVLNCDISLHQNVSNSADMKSFLWSKCVITVLIWNSSCDQNAPKQCCYECETVPPVKMCQDRSDVTQFHWSTFVKTVLNCDISLHQNVSNSADMKSFLWSKCVITVLIWNSSSDQNTPKQCFYECVKTVLMRNNSPRQNMSNSADPLIKMFQNCADMKHAVPFRKKCVKNVVISNSSPGQNVSNS